MATTDHTVHVQIVIDGTCSTCKHLTPATAEEPERWEQSNGAMRFVRRKPAAPASCGHGDDDVMRIEDSWDDGAVLVILQPDRFGCTRWEANA